jgi:hypothetical protein
MDPTLSSTPAATADLLVFDRGPESVHLLTEVVQSSPALQKVVVAWLADRNTQFFVVGTTGGATQKTFTLGARDVPHLRDKVLAEAIALIDPSALANATCSAVDAKMTKQIAAAWASALAAANRGPSSQSTLRPSPSPDR